jgi:hypothetical protein
LNKYRCAEWNDITWSNSWIVLGCSSVEGIGLDESDVLSTRLSELLDNPVINLGVGGTGADVTLFNSIRLIDKNIRPKGVIIINGDFTLTRLSLFTSRGSIAIGNWSFDKKINQGKFSNLYSLWTNEAGHSETYSYMCLRGAISMWKTENIPTFYFNIERDLPKKIVGKVYCKHNYNSVDIFKLIYYKYKKPQTVRNGAIIKLLGCHLTLIFCQ